MGTDRRVLAGDHLTLPHRWPDAVPQEQGRYHPFAGPAALIDHVHFHLLGRWPTRAEFELWTRRLREGREPAALVSALVSSPEALDDGMALVCRLALVGAVSGTPTPGQVRDLHHTWRRGATPLLLARRVTRWPWFALRYQERPLPEMALMLYRDALALPPTQKWLYDTVTAVEAGERELHDIVLELATSDLYRVLHDREVVVLRLHRGLTGVVPGPGDFADQVHRLHEPGGLDQLVDELLASPECHARFVGARAA